MINYKWRLVWSGRKDSPKLRAVVSFITKMFPLASDSEFHLINFEEYNDLVKAKEIAEPVSYWKIGKDEVGAIALTEFDRFSNTWSKIDNAKTDFEAGWEARNETS